MGVTVVVSPDGEGACISFINSSGEMEYSTYEKIDGGVETHMTNSLESLSASALDEAVEDCEVYKMKEVPCIGVSIDQ